MAELSAGITPVTGLGALRIVRVGRGGAATPALPGFDFAAPPATAVHAGAAILATIAPGEWLLLAPSAEIEAARAAIDGPEMLVVDVGDSMLVLRLATDIAAEAVATYCPIDRASDLAPGRLAATLFGDADALLIGEADGAVLMIAPASIQPYFEGLFARLS